VRVVDIPRFDPPRNRGNFRIAGILGVLFLIGVLEMRVLARVSQGKSAIPDSFQAVKVKNDGEWVMTRGVWSLVAWGIGSGVSFPILKLLPPYWITWFARLSTSGGIATLSARAVFKFTVSS